MKAIQDRIILETSIIAEIFFDPNAYMKVAGILSPLNFSDPLYKKIYKGCQELYPDQEISVASIHTKTSIPIIELMIEEPCSPKLSANIGYNAFLLLECSVQEQYIALVKKFISENESPEKGNDLQECYELATEENADIFKSVEIALGYFKANQPLFNDEYERLKEFDENVIKKCDLIRSNLHIKTLFSNLDNLYQFDFQKKELLKALSNITRYVMATNEVPADVTSKIFTLSNIF